MAVAAGGLEAVGGLTSARAAPGACGFTDACGTAAAGGAAAAFSARLRYSRKHALQREWWPDAARAACNIRCTFKPLPDNMHTEHISQAQDAHILNLLVVQSESGTTLFLHRCKSCKAIGRLTL